MSKVIISGTFDLFHHSYLNMLKSVKEIKGQRIEDIQKYKVNNFVIDSEWKGKFDMRDKDEILKNYSNFLKLLSENQIGNLFK